MKIIKEEKLTERNWNTRLKAGSALRRAIAEEDYQGIIDGIRACYKEMLDKGIIDESIKEDFEEDREDTLAEISNAILNDYTHGLTNTGHSWSLDIDWGELDESLKEDLENLESTDNTVVINQPTGAAEEDSKKYKKRFEDATKEPEDAPLFGAKEQPKPDEVEEPKVELKESKLKEMARDSQVNYGDRVIIRPSQTTLRGLMNDEERAEFKALRGERGTITKLQWMPGGRWEHTRGQYLITVKLDNGKEYDVGAGDLILTGDNVNRPVYQESLKESKLALDEGLFNEGVEDVAYQMADEIDERFREQGFISWDDFNEAFEDAYPGLIDWTDDSFNDLETDVRGILSNMGWETIFEGENEGGLNLLESFNKKKRNLKEASWRGLAYYEYPKGSKCHVRETHTSFVATNEHGSTIGESPTKSGCEAIIDEYLKKDESLSEASTLPTGGKDEKFDTDAWSVIYWELSNESEGSADRKMARRAKVNAPMDSRYEHVDPVNDFDLRVYAADESGFDLAKKIADAWGVKYKIENTNSIHANKFPEEKLQMTLLIPEEMIG